MSTQDQILNAFGKLADLYSDDSILEIMVDGPDQVRVDRNGTMVLEKGIITSEQEIREIILNLFKLVGREFPQQGWGSIRLSDGSRVMAVGDALSVNGPIFNIMKLPPQVLDWDGLLKYNAITQEGKDLIESIMKSGKNVILGGSYGSGKTTLANNIVSIIPDEFRVVCLEKVPSLESKHPWLVRLQTADNEKEGMHDLLSAASLMRPDYLVINEIVGEEIPLMLDMMREGYSILGCMTADSSTDVLRRLELKYVSSEVAFTVEQIKEVIGSSLDYIIFIANTDKGRRVTEVIELSGFEDGKYILKPVYRWDGE